MNVSQTGRSLLITLALIALPLTSAAGNFGSSLDHGFDEPQAVAPRPGFHAVERLGITLGGDVISKIVNADGTIREISAGGLYQAGLGALYQYDVIPFAVEMTLNYHYDSDYNGNDNASFRRVPLEGLVYFTGMGRVRIGAGIRYVYSARADSTHNGVTEKISFQNAHGSIVEVGYQVNAYGWVSLRYVKEQYVVESYSTTGTATGTAAPPSGNTPYDGSHVGLFISYEF